MWGKRTVTEAEFLAKGVESVRDLFESRGFAYCPEAAGTSSGGPFASAHFRRDDLDIGLIVRERRRLGCPNYSLGKGFAGHESLARALGVGGQEELVEGKHLEFQSRIGRDPFLALRSDLANLFLPVLDRSEQDFRAAIARAVQEFHLSLGF
jgi:hypothetical protein